jgi:DNA polymerase I-like protein with 3'-5' exonuclease and polymerase domains
MALGADFLRYNCLDAACTLEAHDAFWAELKQGYEPAYNMTVDLFPVLMFMQTRGIRVNHEDMETTKIEIMTTANAKQEELNKLCGRSVNVNSSKDMQTYFYVELGIPPYFNDGKVTVNDLALQRMARGTAKRTGLYQAKLVQDIRGLGKLYSTYLDISFDTDSRMRCSYNPRGTKFGRLSSSKTVFGSGTNMQNLPQEFKRFLQADEGYMLWEIDKRQAEWVVVAYLTGDANMISTIEAGRDTHVHTASLMFDCDPEIIEAENKIVGHLTDPDMIAQAREDAGLGRVTVGFPRVMSGRQCGKKSNHGLNYDEGFVQFALINEIEQRESKRIVELYHQIYPGIRVWYEQIKRALQKDRALTNCFGRKVRFMDAYGPDMWKAAYSMLPQSSVVDSLNQGMIRIYEDKWLCKELNIDVLAQVHDSVLMQVPLEVVQGPDFAEAVDLVYTYCSPTMHYNSRSFKIATDSKLGLNWGGASKTNPQGMQDLDLEALPKLLENLNVTRTG